MLKPLTDRQVQILAFIEDCKESPTLREIGAAFGLKPNVVHGQLVRIAEKGWIERERYKARSIRVLHRLPEGA